ncbi:8491_t:CDS:2 [Ambispora gerdemannii]|uniref:8491_t:CDS:1 n=1 Tax=Ambispora gerdemannii TaxID=144530 RepID=A0A9N9BGC0_9GLOM|nr:8491_t:CDS:2 [Ambispora gerdemannii]
MEQARKEIERYKRLTQYLVKQESTQHDKIKMENFRWPSKKRNVTESTLFKGSPSNFLHSSKPKYEDVLTIVDHNAFSKKSNMGLMIGKGRFQPEISYFLAPSVNTNDYDDLFSQEIEALVEKIDANNVKKLHETTGYDFFEEDDWMKGMAYHYVQISTEDMLRRLLDALGFIYKTKRESVSHVEPITWDTVIGAAQMSELPSSVLEIAINRLSEVYPTKTNNSEKISIIKAYHNKVNELDYITQIEHRGQKQDKGKTSKKAAASNSNNENQENNTDKGLESLQEDDITE